MKQQIEELKKIVMLKQSQYSQLYIKYKQVINDHRNKKDLQTYKVDENQLRQKIYQLQIPILFHGDLLFDFLKHKYFLKTQIETLNQKIIKRTHLIYKFDPYNHTSFHKYVDQIPDIVLIVKTKEDFFLRAYSESPIGHHPADKKGIIMSLTRQKVFPVLQGKKSVSYDQYSLIVGNAQIKINPSGRKIFSRFGLSFGFYDVKDGTVDDLLGKGEQRETIFQGFEVHRVVFE